VSQRTHALLGGRLSELKAIIAHLGNGASITAVNGGRSVDTSMGLTPLEGLVMGTRPGDLDAGIVLFAMRQLGLSAGEVDRIFNRESGLLGISGISNDMRDIEAEACTPTG
jgi:acetate kinase